ncbi:hypothetical protein B296_00032743 [Ensete ventricosum]|uniref:Uncharacterized protein n=1 Tax=Ensete ventricosum TaxID=4639 RepID=A0A426YDU2_ENSVE|nr:hypothetical protein B296_00032743 [Ensete ventricosum]
MSPRRGWDLRTSAGYGINGGSVNPPCYPHRSDGGYGAIGGGVDVWEMCKQSSALAKVAIDVAQESWGANVVLGLTCPG